MTIFVKFSAKCNHDRDWMHCELELEHSRDRNEQVPEQQVSREGDAKK